MCGRGNSLWRSAADMVCIPSGYRRRHRQSVIVRAPQSFIDEVLWPEFEELGTALTAYLSEITERVIREEVHRDTGKIDDSKQIGR